MVRYTIGLSLVLVSAASAQKVDCAKDQLNPACVQAVQNATGFHPSTKPIAVPNDKPAPPVVMKAPAVNVPATNSPTTLTRQPSTQTETVVTAPTQPSNRKEYERNYQSGEAVGNAIGQVLFTRKKKTTSDDKELKDARKQLDDSIDQLCAITPQGTYKDDVDGNTVTRSCATRAKK